MVVGEQHDSRLAAEVLISAEEFPNLAELIEYANAHDMDSYLESLGISPEDEVGPTPVGV